MKTNDDDEDRYAEFVHHLKEEEGGDSTSSSRDPHRHRYYSLHDKANEESAKDEVSEFLGLWHSSSS